MPQYSEALHAAIEAAAAAERARGPEAGAARVAALRKLLAVRSGEADQVRSEALLRLARVMWLSGVNVLNAVEAAAFGVGLCRTAGDSQALCRGLLLQGTVLNAVGNYVDGWSCFEEAFEVAQRLRSPLLASMAASNMGNTCAELGRYGRAAELFRLALGYADQAAVSDPAGARQRRASALANLALCRLHTEEIRDGVSASEEALKLLGEPKDAQSALARVLAEVVYTKLLLRLGRLDDARAAAARAHRYAQASGLARAAIEAEGALGLVEIVSGSTDIGRSRVLKALERARLIPETLRDALLTAAAASDASGDATAALAYQREFSLLTRQAFVGSQLRRRSAELVTDAEDEQTIERVFGLQESKFRQHLARQVGSEARLVSLAIRAEAAVDPEGVHPFRLASLVRLLALRLGEESARRSEDYARAALLHDVGMSCVPRSIQLKPEPLVARERALVTRHPDEGALLVLAADLPYADVAEQAVRWHHERWDGEGYPDGLIGNGIPLVARMCALADAFDVMVHGRPYGIARTVDEALAEIAGAAGRQFDPVLATHFVQMVRQLQHDHADLSAYLAREAAHMPLARARAIMREAAGQPLAGEGQPPDQEGVDGTR